MTPRVQEIFHEVADLSQEARDQYFGDHDVEHDVRAEVEALIAFDSAAGWDRSRAESWLAARLPLHPGRFAILPSTR